MSFLTYLQREQLSGFPVGISGRRNPSKMKFTVKGKNLLLREKFLYPSEREGENVKGRAASHESILMYSASLV